MGEGADRVEVTDFTGNALAGSDVLSALDADGGVLFSAADRDDVSGWLSPLLSVYRHPHAEASGWTFFRPGSASGRAANARGFTAAELSPHTDRSSLRMPPSLLCFLMLRSPLSGGDILLADTAGALRGFSLGELSAVQRELSLKDSRGRIRQQVLSVDGGLVIGRYRTDHVAVPHAGSAAAGEVLAELRRVAASPRRLRLRAGEGYLIHNHRILHGRTAFFGSRQCARLLGFVKNGSPHARLNRGFRNERVDEAQVNA